ncbi:MAG: hypothetical protein RLN69_11375, partial [Woeseiaceae bacterium]
MTVGRIARRLTLVIGVLLAVIIFAALVTAPRPLHDVAPAVVPGELHEYWSALNESSVHRRSPIIPG